MPNPAQRLTSNIRKMQETTRNQATLARPVTLSGCSLFRGYPVNVTLLPADADNGVQFQRTDKPGSSPISAIWQSVDQVPRRTVLKSSSGEVVETVEHLLAALAGLGIDNCTIETDGPELPGFDGSSLAWADAILDAGVELSSEPVRIFQADQNDLIQSTDLKQSLNLRPYAQSLTAATYHLDYGPRAPVQPQTYSAEITPELFYSDIAPARTFVLESEIAALKQLGFGHHLTPEDILVFGDSGVIGNKTRWDDECARHKILDCIGDLSLCGMSIYGHVTGHRSGHHLNHKLAELIHASSPQQIAAAA